MAGGGRAAPAAPAAPKPAAASAPSNDQEWEDF
jgi:hypothetical protein